MKFSPFIAPSIVLMVVAFNQTFAGSSPDNQAVAQISAEHVHADFHGRNGSRSLTQLPNGW